MLPQSFWEFKPHCDIDLGTTSVMGTWTDCYRNRGVGGKAAKNSLNFLWIVLDTSPEMTMWGWQGYNPSINKCYGHLGYMSNWGIKRHTHSNTHIVHREFTLPTSCMSCSCLSCDRVWCLRASCRAVSPSLSAMFRLQPSRTNSWTKPHFNW